jgi:hypothetical protein
MDVVLVLAVPAPFFLRAKRCAVAPYQFQPLKEKIETIESLEKSGQFSKVQKLGLTIKCHSVATVSRVWLWQQPLCCAITRSQPMRKSMSRLLIFAVVAPFNKCAQRFMLLLRLKETS